MITPAQAEDVEELLDLYRHLIADEEALDPEGGRRRLAVLTLYPGSGIFILRDGGVLAASATLIVIPNLTRQGRPYALIENVVTHAGHRRRGFGTAVVQAAIDAARQAGCYKVMLLPGSRDPATHRFYQVLGFDRGKTGYRLRL